jgi:hypothetical protein
VIGRGATTIPLCFGCGDVARCWRSAILARIS